MKMSRFTVLNVITLWLDGETRPRSEPHAFMSAGHQSVCVWVGVCVHILHSSGIILSYSCWVCGPLNCRAAFKHTHKQMRKEAWCHSRLVLISFFQIQPVTPPKLRWALHHHMHKENILLSLIVGLWRRSERRASQTSHANAAERSSAAQKALNGDNEAGGRRPVRTEL